MKKGEKRATTSLKTLQVSLSLTRAVKYNRISKDGGYIKSNASLLLSEAEDICQRIGSCTRVVRTLLPIQPKPAEKP